MLVLGGPALAVGGCALFLAYLNINGGSSTRDTISAAGAIIFIGGEFAGAMAGFALLGGYLGLRPPFRRSATP